MHLGTRWVDLIAESFWRLVRPPLDLLAWLPCGMTHEVAPRSSARLHRPTPSGTIKYSGDGEWPFGLSLIGYNLLRNTITPGYHDVSRE